MNIKTPGERIIVNIIDGDLHFSQRNAMIYLITRASGLMCQRAK